jgi:hypothetical protein
MRHFCSTAVRCCGSFDREEDVGAGALTMPSPPPCFNLRSTQGLRRLTSLVQHELEKKVTA